MMEDQEGSLGRASAEMAEIAAGLRHAVRKLDAAGEKLAAAYANMALTVLEQQLSKRSGTNGRQAPGP